VPVLINVTLVPDTVQTFVVVDANATVSPELAVALTVIDPVESGLLGKLGNVIVWLALVTWKPCVTGVAAARFALRRRFLQVFEEQTNLAEFFQDIVRLPTRDAGISGRG